LAIVNDHPDEAPHTLVVGTSGTGKTTLAQAIAATRTDFLAILDLKWKPGKWGGLSAIPIDDDGRYTQLEAGAKALLEELTNRLVSLKQGVTTFPPLTIVAEEFPTLIAECPSAAELFKQVGRLGRELRIRLVGLSQSERVKSLGISGEGDAKDNYTIIRLGKAALDVMPGARHFPRPAVLEWKGAHRLLLLEGLLHLATRPIAPSRAWVFETPYTGTPKQTQKQDEAEELFTIEEVGQIVALILSGIEGSAAVRSMPRYNRRRHRIYLHYFERLKAALEAAHNRDSGDILTTPQKNGGSL